MGRWYADIQLIGEWVMTYERWRIAAESFGLAALIGSLIFVGLQLRQEHEIAVAELNHARNELMVNRFSAALDSEAYLSAYAKLYATRAWPTGTLTEPEIAATEIDAILWWTYLETEFWHRQQGLIDDDEWVAWEANIRMSDQLSPVYRAVFQKYWTPAPSDYTRSVEAILSEGHVARGQQ